MGLRAHSLRAVILGGAILLTCAPETSAKNDSLLVSLAPETWHALPNSAMRQVCPTSPPGILQGTCDCACAINAWNGAAYDPLREQLILWGGGHNNYYGNELYSFDIKTLKWSLLTPPSVPAPPGACPEALGDGTPNSRHTYGGLAFLTHADRFFAHGGALSCVAGDWSEATWTFDIDARSWQQMRPSGEGPTWNNVDAYSAYDPVSRKVFLFWHTELFSYDYDSNTMTQLDDGQIDWGAYGCAIDPKRGLLFEVGNGFVAARSIRNGNYRRQIWQTSGGAPVVNAYAPGLEYDPVADKLVAWDGGSVFELNLDTRQWREIAAAGSPARTETGIFGRFRYLPAQNVYIAVTSADVDVHFFKLTSGGLVTPVEMGAFSASAGVGEIVLNWTTESETNNYGFDVERRSPGTDFRKIAFLRGGGTLTSRREYRYADRAIQPNTPYTYRLKQIDNDGTFAYAGEVHAHYEGKIDYELLWNYPNPFNAGTRIRFRVPAQTRGSLQVYNERGDTVATLLDNEELNAGEQSVLFQPVGLSTGIYFYELLTASGRRLSGKMLYLK